MRNSTTYNEHIVYCLGSFTSKAYECTLQPTSTHPCATMIFLWSFKRQKAPSQSDSFQNFLTLTFLIHLKITVLLMRQGLQRNVSYPILVCKWLARMRVMKSGQGYLTMDQCLYLSNQVHIWPQICPL